MHRSLAENSSSSLQAGERGLHNVNPITSARLVFHPRKGEKKPHSHLRNCVGTRGGILIMVKVYVSAMLPPVFQGKYQMLKNGTKTETQQKVHGGESRHISGLLLSWNTR